MNKEKTGGASIEEMKKNGNNSFTFKDQTPPKFGKQCLVCSIFDYSNDGILVIDQNHDKILSENSCASHIFGYTRQEFLTGPISSLLPEIL